MDTPCCLAASMVVEPKSKRRHSSTQGWKRSHVHGTRDGHPFGGPPKLHEEEQLALVYVTKQCLVSNTYRDYSLSKSCIHSQLAFGFFAMD